MLAASVHAQQFPAGSLVIEHPWSRPTAAGMPMGVAYLSITNNGPQEDVLLSAHTPAAARVEFHRTILEGGMARMRPAGALSGLTYWRNMARPEAIAGCRPVS